MGLRTWKDALRLMCAEMIGAFLGSLLVYGLFLPHYSLIPPMPQPPHWTDAVLQPQAARPTHVRDAFISFEAGPTGDKRQSATLRHRHKQVYFLWFSEFLFQAASKFESATLLHLNASGSAMSRLICNMMCVTLHLRAHCDHKETHASAYT